MEPGGLSTMPAAGGFPARMAADPMFRELCENTPALLWIGDAEGGCVYLNPALRRFWGIGEDFSAFNWGMTLHPEDADALARPFTHGMMTRTPFEVSARYRRADGVYRVLRTQATPRFDADGVFLGMLGVNADITDLLEAERVARDSENLRKAILDSSLDAIVTVDHHGRFLEFNRAAEILFGFSRGEVLGREMSEYIIPPAMRASHEAGMARYLATGESRVLDQRLELPARRADGTEFPAEVAIVRIAGTEPPLFTAFIRDITARRQAEEHARFLMGELNHRTKNIMSVVQAVARQTARHSSPETFAAAFNDRLSGLAASNDLLLSRNWSGVDLADLAQAQLGHLGALIGTRLVIGGPSLRVASTVAQTLGMALHELSTNSIKHGALSQPAGAVRLEWSYSDEDGPVFAMRWSETGVAGVRKPERRGFGHSVIVDMVSSSLPGEVELDFGEGGLRWSVTARTSAIEPGSGPAPRQSRS